MPLFPLKILIVDDEELARRRLHRLLGELPGCEILGECASGQEALALLARGDLEIDVLLLDVRMPGLGGLEAAALLPEDGPYVIFTTAHAEHALAAFDLGAVDYLLKPIEAVRLGRALERARHRLGPRQPPGELHRLPVSTRAGIVLLDPRALTHALFDGALVTLHTASGPLLTEQSLQELEDRLPAALFERVHRRALVNLEKIERLEPQETGGYIARMPGGAEVPIARQAARRLRRRLGLT
ncbi:MAG: response regulator [Nannocystis sp.]|jgi:two-component system LytT family response regulator|nr:response regulator [Nannocystis sp.]